ncbi:MAG: response regulator [Sulfurovum sp.]|nr:response regulator [Sulfurovum sp.]
MYENDLFDLYQSKKPDIIISDIKMPYLNGLDMAKKIRKEDKTTPIIITTAFTDTSYMLQAVELQLIKYIVKPITSIKLKEALSLLMEHLNINNIIVLDKKKYYDSFNKCLMIEKKVIILRKKRAYALRLIGKEPS